MFERFEQCVSARTYSGGAAYEYKGEASGEVCASAGAAKNTGDKSAQATESTAAEATKACLKAATTAAAKGCEWVCNNPPGGNNCDSNMSGITTSAQPAVKKSSLFGTSFEVSCKASASCTCINATNGFAADVWWEATHTWTCTKNP